MSGGRDQRQAQTVVARRGRQAVNGHVVNQARRVSTSVKKRRRKEDEKKKKKEKKREKEGCNRTAFTNVYDLAGVPVQSKRTNDDDDDDNDDDDDEEEEEQEEEEEEEEEREREGKKTKQNTVKNESQTGQVNFRLFLLFF